MSIRAGHWQSSDCGSAGLCNIKLLAKLFSRRFKQDLQNTFNSLYDEALNTYE